MTGVIRSPGLLGGRAVCRLRCRSGADRPRLRAGLEVRAWAGGLPHGAGGLLLLIGLASLVRSFFAAGEPISAIAWKGLLLVTLATVLFGALLRPAGLVIALAAVILVSAAASVRFRFDARALALMGALIVFCGLVFVTGLGLPVSLLGTWFTR
ncbi:MAG: tripartite tricarboxylate transporter TctB family protein [Betaproteobacteria bacterium]|nr:tripartite tricarboxylate transporter TctB family protein [Betaproteobacteria bacterium]